MARFQIIALDGPANIQIDNRGFGSNHTSLIAVGDTMEIDIPCPPELTPYITIAYTGNRAEGLMHVPGAVDHCTCGECRAERKKVAAEERAKPKEEPVRRKIDMGEE